MAIVVVYNLLNRVDQQHNDQRRDGCKPRCGRQPGDELQDGNDEEIQVGDARELLEEVDWQERQLRRRARC